MKYLICLCLVVVAFTIHPQYNSVEELVDYINNSGTTWKAGINTIYNHNNPELVRHLMGVIPTPDHLKLQVKTDYPDVSIPDSFDPRDQWPKCESIKEVRDQSNCGSCWAHGAAEAISDRMCIKSGQVDQTRISAEDLVECCNTILMCNGCQGGMMAAPWNWWKNHGICTGNAYGDTKYCKPYYFEPHHHGEGYADTPACQKQCNSKYTAKTYDQDKFFASSVYSVSESVSSIQTEMMTNGPIECAFTVYEDFMTYKTGVYQHTTGKQLGGHAIKCMGWGVENSTPYWLCANSWNVEWGDQGFFKILRGSNHCGIESQCHAGIPK